MTWGVNGAGPLGVPPCGPNGPLIGAAGANYPPLFNASFESVMAAVSRGEVSLNTLIAGSNQYGGINNANNQAGNPTLLQAISQGLPQNGTNGLGTSGANGGTINSGSAGGGGGLGTTFGGTQTIDAKQMVGAAGVALSSPLQYGGA